MIRERIKGATDQEPQQLVKDAYADFMKLLE
jgi:hypothetical protein